MSFSPHENGDVEQRHNRFKKAVEQALLLRGERNFENLQSYDRFLRKLYKQLNAGRRERFSQELSVLRRLPERRLDSYKKMTVRVGAGSTIRVNRNVYSVTSRLIGEKVQVRLFVDRLEIFYGQKRVDTLPRIRGERKAAINYRHIIDSLVRKPGAFENYRYRDELFPSIRFRIAFDHLKKRHSSIAAARHYLQILYLAAKGGETVVDDALRILIDTGETITEKKVKALVSTGQDVPPITDVTIAAVNLHSYDALLEEAPC